MRQRPIDPEAAVQHTGQLQRQISPALGARRFPIGLDAALLYGIKQVVGAAEQHPTRGARDGPFRHLVGVEIGLAGGDRRQCHQQLLAQHLVRLLVREITRSPHIDDELDEIGQAFASLERIIRRGQGEGTLRPELDARLAAWMLYGSLEEVLTGWVLGQLPDDADGIAAAEHEVIATIVGGLRAAT